jgi:glycosyltransferase involved in cell wall biosynthesis
MRIAILTTHKNGIGGVERFSSHVKLAARNNGFDSVVYGREDLSGMSRALVSFSKVFGLGQPALGFFLGRHACTNGFDICVTNGLLGWNLSGASIVNVQHGTFARAADRIDAGNSLVKFFIKKYMWGYFEGRAARTAGTCIAVSNETKESVAQYYGRTDAVVMLNAVDTDMFAPSDKAAARTKLGLSQDRAVMAFVGRFERAKGKAILESLKARGENGGPELVVAATYDQVSLAALYAAADVFVFPSLHEGCSYALLEAMSTGLPFVAAPVGLVSDFAARGLFSECIVTKHSADAYEAKIAALLVMTAEEKHALTLSLRAYIVESHSFTAFSQAYGTLFRNIL